jgi:hypothetical protein
MRIDPEKYAVSDASLRGRLTHYAQTCGWVLCVGAGVSNGVFPAWDELATELVALSDLGCSPSVLKQFLLCFGPEALMQAVVNSLPEEERTAVPDFLRNALYRKIRSKAGSGWETVAKGLTSSKPFNLNLDEWNQFAAFTDQFDEASAPAIARVISKAINTPSRPEAIISFNAEPLLYGLINCHYALQNPKALKDAKVKVLKRLSHDLASGQSGQIPYYYVHGILPVPDGSDRFNKGIGVDKLVFTESHYLELSRSVYSWQSATFLASCLHHRCVFIGLSFTDPNLRRWLAWEHEGRHSQRKRQRLALNRTTHFWLRKRPHAKGEGLSCEQRLVEKSVEHLGIQIIWLSDWSEIEQRLKSMLSII